MKFPFYSHSERPVKTHGPRVLTGYTFRDRETFFMENELLRLSVLVGRGGTIHELTYKPKDVDVLYKSPAAWRDFGRRIPDACGENLHGEFNLGGWFECFPSASVPTTYKGVRQGFHGELWGLPGAVTEIEESEEKAAVTTAFLTVKAPLKLSKCFSLRRGEAVVRLEETVVNLAEEDWDLLWGHHPMFGPPFLGEDCVVESPARSYTDWDEQPMTSRPWPATGPEGKGKEAAGKTGEDLRRVRPKSARAGKMFFLTDFADGRGFFRLVGERSGLAAEMNWDGQRFPYLWLCENAGGFDAPGFGRAHYLCLEPFSGLPRALETGRGVLTVPAGGKLTTEFTLRLTEI